MTRAGIRPLPAGADRRRANRLTGFGRATGWPRGSAWRRQSPPCPSVTAGSAVS